MKDNLILKVIGTAQDGGVPHLGCVKSCCNQVWNDKNKIRNPSSIAIINKKAKKYWLFDITPQIKVQMHSIQHYGCKLAGVFITHAHYGHYIGLLELGLEVLNTKSVPIYVMPRMFNFINNNKPFNLLISNQNIVLEKINSHNSLNLFPGLKIYAFEVPHRNEFSETVGFNIKSKNKSIIYLPDIDTWDKWNDNLLNVIKDNDLLFIDGTFYDHNELINRNTSSIPHPSIKDTIERLDDLNISEKNKIFFIHFNHTNPVINVQSKEYKELSNKGYNVVNENQIFTI